MTMFSVNDQCVGCGLCAELCVAGIISHEKKSRPFVPAEKEADCIKCGQCVSFCPEGASFLDFQPAADRCQVDVSLKPSAESAEMFLMSRRSIRRYKDEPVEKELVERLLNITRFAPTASNFQPVRWIVTADRNQTLALGRLASDYFRRMSAAAPDEAVPAMLGKVAAAFDRGRDVLFRTAPQLALAVVNKGIRYPEDAAIALTYFELAAHAFGLGCCWAGFFTTAARNDAALKEALGVAENEIVIGGQMFGRPRGLGWPRLLPPRRPLMVKWLGGEK